MMNAQETRRLLELAAKAAGVEIGTWSNCQPGGFVKGGSGVFWNPLTSDGDALRLEVALRLSVVRSLRGDAMAMNHDFSVSVTEPAGEDPCATTRLVIVRAAAAVGEQMENDDAEDD